MWVVKQLTDFLGGGNIFNSQNYALGVLSVKFCFKVNSTVENLKCDPSRVNKGF